MDKKVLIIEDDPDIADLIYYHLKDVGFIPENVFDGESGLEKALENDYQFVILDLMLPRLDGYEVCKRIREVKKTLPILMLTSKSDEFDKVLGLELGADDYLTKPFGLRELTARIKAILRRGEAVKDAIAEDAQKEVLFGDMVINLEKRKVTLGGRTIELTAKEFDLLALFAAHPGRAYTRQELLDIVWGYQFDGYDHTVNSHINRLRAKVEPDPANPTYIKTVWGVGYRFSEEEELLP